MSDNRMKDRVKVLLNGTSSESETSEHALVSPAPQQPPAHPNQALQVLTLAQRTAEEHVARAHHQADKIRTDALAAAEQIARDAQVHAHNVRREADKVLTDARAASEQVARDSHARTEEARRTADKIVAEARAASEQIVAEARANSEHLNLQASQRYDDVVGSLGTKREALQNQIEALEAFDREYRARLTTFMQGQLRALWVDQPQVNAELPEQALVPELAGAGGPMGGSAGSGAAGGNAVAGGAVSGNAVAGGAVSGGAVSGNAVAGSAFGGGAQQPVAEERAPEASGPRHGVDEAEDSVPAQRQSPESDENEDDEEFPEG